MKVTSISKAEYIFMQYTAFVAAKRQNKILYLKFMLWSIKIKNNLRSEGLRGTAKGKSYGKLICK